MRWGTETYFTVHFDFFLSFFKNQLFSYLKEMALRKSQVWYALSNSVSGKGRCTAWKVNYDCIILTGKVLEAGISMLLLVLEKAWCDMIALPEQTSLSLTLSAPSTLSVTGHYPLAPVSFMLWPLPLKACVYAAALWPPCDTFLLLPKLSDEPRKGKCVWYVTNFPKEAS